MDRAGTKIENVYDLTKASNFVKNIDPKTGAMVGVDVIFLAVTIETNSPTALSKSQASCGSSW